MKTVLMVPFRSDTYQVTVAGNRIIHVIKIHEDSGIERQVTFDTLPPLVQDLIIHAIYERNDVEDTDNAYRPHEGQGCAE